MKMGRVCKETKGSFGHLKGTLPLWVPQTSLHNIIFSHRMSGFRPWFLHACHERDCKASCAQPSMDTALGWGSSIVLPPAIASFCFPTRLPT
jgi:hypothetical protein